MSTPDTWDEAARWLELACGDLVTAEAMQRDRRIPARNVALHAQQSAEKAIKAALASEGQRPPRWHDLDALRNELGPGWRVHATHPDLARLTQYSVEARYPDDLPPITKTQSRASVRQAQTLYRRICDDLERRGFDLSHLGCR